jgi:hypothetical protein
MLQSEMQEGSGRGRIEIKDFSHEVIDACQVIIGKNGRKKQAREPSSQLCCD